ncbi:hypothetical protein KC19_10G011800 [Ceratodon purpureus]|uniref:Secreted protein n=1 Tax=Ceratodon purpureus TaxID=3225 RepID=A0A8T0GGQ7_CERPU|nr:hypothetical protein KC19_10G011800 [Ceratodon purpureus]
MLRFVLPLGIRFLCTSVALAFEEYSCNMVISSRVIRTESTLSKFPTCLFVIFKTSTNYFLYVIYGVVLMPYHHRSIEPKGGYVKRKRRHSE